MTNEQRLRELISTTEGFANYLVEYDDYYEEYLTSDGERFNTQTKATEHEISWLKEEYNL